MKLTIAIFSILLLFSGCKDSVNPDPIVKVTDKCGADNILISDIKGRKKDDGFMKAQVRGYNNSDNYELLEYQIIWLDSDGFKINSILSNWSTVPAYANRAFYINGISPNTKAKSFRIYIRKNKEIICNEQSEEF